MASIKDFFIKLCYLIPFLRGSSEGASGVSDAEVVNVDQAVEEAPEMALMQAGDAQIADEEMGLAPPQTKQAAEVNGGTGPGEQTRQSPEAKQKQRLSLSFAFITIAFGVLVNLFFIRRDTKPLSENRSLTFAALYAFVSLVSATALMLHTMKQMTSLRPQLIQRNHPSCSNSLLYAATTSLSLTILAIILSFLPKSYYILPVVLVPSLLVAGFHFYPRPVADDEYRQGDDPHKADRKRSVQLTLSMTSFSFLGMLGTLLGYHKNSSNRADHVYVKVAIYFMLGATLTGIVSALLSQVLPKISGSSRRKDWKMMAVGNVIMLSLLSPAVLMVATTFLEGLVAVAFFPVVIGAAVWYFVEYHVPDSRAVAIQETELKPMYTVSMTAISMSFGAIMTMFAGFLGGEANGNRLRVCVFFVVSCFVAAVSLGLMTFRPPKKASLGAAATALACCTLGLLVLAALALVSLVGP